MIAFGRQIAVGARIGACCTLMLSGCRAPGPPVARSQRIKPLAQEEITEQRPPVDQPKVPRDDAALLPVASEEPLEASGQQVGRASRGRETTNGLSGRPVREKSPDPPNADSESQRLPEGSADESPIERTSETDAAPAADQESDEILGSGNDNVSASPADNRRDDGDPNGPANKMSQQADAETEQREAANRGGRGTDDPVLSKPALVPVIPARVQKTASTASGEIVYPQAPPPIAVSREQVDALRLPSTDPKRPIIGIWEQVGRVNSADFAEGNYTHTVLVFRADGVLEVVRWFGSEDEIRIDSKLNYTVTGGDRIRLELPPGSHGASRRAYSIPLSDGTSVRVEPSQTEFPATLTFRQENGKLVIEGKTYRRAESQ